MSTGIVNFKYTTLCKFSSRFMKQQAFLRREKKEILSFDLIQNKEDYYKKSIIIVVF